MSSNRRGDEIKKILYSPADQLSWERCFENLDTGSWKANSLKTSGLDSAIVEITGNASLGPQIGFHCAMLSFVDETRPNRVVCCGLSRRSMMVLQNLFSEP